MHKFWFHFIRKKKGRKNENWNPNISQVSKIIGDSCISNVSDKASYLLYIMWLFFLLILATSAVFSKTMQELIEFSPQITLKLEMRHLTNIMPTERKFEKFSYQKKRRQGIKLTKPNVFDMATNFVWAIIFNRLCYFHKTTDPIRLEFTIYHRKCRRKCYWPESL